MTAAKQIEYAIARRLIRRGSSQSEAAGQPARQPWVDRLIAVLAATAGLAVVGSYAEELLWLVVAVATVITLK